MSKLYEMELLFNGVGNDVNRCFMIENDKTNRMMIWKRVGFYMISYGTKKPRE
jgi:hypothetical protein